MGRGQKGGFILTLEAVEEGPKAVELLRQSHVMLASGPGGGLGDHLQKGKGRRNVASVFVNMLSKNSEEMIYFRLPSKSFPAFALQEVFLQTNFVLCLQSKPVSSGET